MNIGIFYFYFAKEKNALYKNLGYFIYGATTAFIHSANVLIYYYYDRYFSMRFKYILRFMMLQKNTIDNNKQTSAVHYFWINKIEIIAKFYVRNL